MSSILTAIVHKEDNLYVAQCPEVGTASQGETIEEAVANLQEATELYLEDQTRERADGSQAHVMRWWVWAFDRTLEGERRR